MERVERGRARRRVVRRRGARRVGERRGAAVPRLGRPWERIRVHVRGGERRGERRDGGRKEGRVRRRRHCARRRSVGHAIHAPHAISVSIYARRWAPGAAPRARRRVVRHRRRRGARGMRMRMGGSRLRRDVHLHVVVIKRSDAARHRQVLALLVVVPLRCFSLSLSSVGMRVLLLVAEEGRAGDGAQGAGERAVGAAVAQLVLPAVGSVLSLVLLLLLKVVRHGS